MSAIKWTCHGLRDNFHSFLACDMLTSRLTLSLSHQQRHHGVLAIARSSLAAPKRLPCSLFTQTLIKGWDWSHVTIGVTNMPQRGAAPWASHNTAHAHEFKYLAGNLLNSCLSAWSLLVLSKCNAYYSRAATPAIRRRWFRSKGDWNGHSGTTRKEYGCCWTERKWGRNLKRQGKEKNKSWYRAWVSHDKYNVN